MASADAAPTKARGTVLLSGARPSEYQVWCQTGQGLPTRKFLSAQYILRLWQAGGSGFLAEGVILGKPAIKTT